jgi:hypothetical protein
MSKTYQCRCEDCNVELGATITAPDGVDPTRALKGYLCQDCAAKRHRASPQCPLSEETVRFGRALLASLEGHPVSSEERDLMTRVINILRDREDVCGPPSTQVEAMAEVESAAKRAAS